MKNKYLLSLLWVIVSGFGILMAQEIAIIPQPVSYTHLTLPTKA